jgi:hypothetical protein
VATERKWTKTQRSREDVLEGETFSGFGRVLQKAAKYGTMKKEV